MGGSTAEGDANRRRGFEESLHAGGRLSMPFNRPRQAQARRPGEGTFSSWIRLKRKSMSVSETDGFKPYARSISTHDDVEDVVQEKFPPNDGSGIWMSANIPFFECPYSDREGELLLPWVYLQKEAHQEETPAGQL